MDSPTQLETVASARTADRDRAATSPPDAAFSALIQTATLEFISSMQLLAERVRFITAATGVAIALKEDGKFVYCVSAGSAAEAGSPVDAYKSPISNCLALAKPSIVSVHTSRGQLVKAAVPVIRQQEVAGFFELSAPRATFSNEDVFAVSGLAEMVNTALDHMEAAENAPKRILQSNPQAKPATVTPLSWHAAREHEMSTKAEPPPSPVPGPLNVQTCQSCGFPVSDGRKLCVECEQNPSAATVQEPRLLVIETEKDESWISTHGYTIASLLVTALVAAIMFWLR